MNLAFASKKLKRQLADEKEMGRAFGHVMPALKRRLDLLRAAPCLEQVPIMPPLRRHELSHDWAGHFAVVLTGNWRLVFRPDHDPVPQRSDGGIDLAAVTAVIIVAIEDYHGN